MAANAAINKDVFDSQDEATIAAIFSAEAKAIELAFEHVYTFYNIPVYSLFIVWILIIHTYWIYSSVIIILCFARRYMVEILPIRRKTLSNHSINFCFRNCLSLISTINQPLCKVAGYQVINLKKKTWTKQMHVFKCILLHISQWIRLYNLGETTGGYYYIGDL